MTKSVHITLQGDDAVENSPPATNKKASAFDLVAAQPWAILPNSLEMIAAIARRENDPIEAVEAKLGRPLQNTRKVTMRGTVAIVPVTGPIFRYANLFSEISGATSLDVLASDFNTALDDPNISAIVLNIDSPGGQAAGISEFAQMIKNAYKPVTAYIDGDGASAAYWIASAADRIVVSKTGEVGSIGAVVSIDRSAKGKDVLEIVSSQSPKKRPDLNTDEGRAQIQARIDMFAQVFIEDVAANRGITVDKVLSDFGQGDMRMGAEAVALGMADEVSTLEAVLSGLLSNNTSGRMSMNTKTNADNAATTDAPVITREFLAANHADIVSAISADAATAERNRIKDVQSQSLAGHDDLIQTLMFDGKTTGAEAAAQIVAAEQKLAKDRVTNIETDAPAVVPHATAPVDGPVIDASLPIEEQAKAEWDAKAELRNEFGKFETYLGYRKAQASGRVKTSGKKKD